MSRLNMDGFSRYGSREEAGDAMARILARETLVNPIVLALPRGGVSRQPELATGRSGAASAAAQYHPDPDPWK